MLRGARLYRHPYIDKPRNIPPAPTHHPSRPALGSNLSNARCHQSTPRPPATRIVYPHRASSPPLASASTPPHDTIVHPAGLLPLNEPGPRTACMLHVTSATAPSYEVRLTSYTLQQRGALQ